MAKGKSSSVGDEPIGDATSIIGSENDAVGSSNSIGGIEIASPTSATGGSGASAGDTNSGTASAKRGRGRPPGSGSGSKAKQKAAPVSVKGIEQLLFTIHLGLVKITGVDELELDKEEAGMLAAAVTEVSSHYNVVVDPKTIAWLGLVGVCGTIYGPRFAAYKLRKQIEKEAKIKDVN